MKQLKKMALKEAEVLTENEKKMVLGGNIENKFNSSKILHVIV